jgi:hypothetical protein
MHHYLCSDAEQEAMMATKRRDWAFSEIDKTVQERESIRTLCDNLRRDRDRAVSELARALRSSDEYEKQKNDAVKELKEIRYIFFYEHFACVVIGTEMFCYQGTVSYDNFVCVLF